MRKMVVRKKAQSIDDLRLFVDEILLFASSEFGWDGFTAEGYLDDGIHVIVIKEK